MATYVHKHEVEALQVPFDVILVKPADKKSRQREERLFCPALGFIVRKGNALTTKTKEEFEQEYQPKRKKEPYASIALSVGEWQPTVIGDEEEDTPSD